MHMYADVLIGGLLHLFPGLEELHNLWEVDAKALGDSDPWKLALAVRSLSPTGPPRRF